MDRVKLGKLLSFVLRHNPQSVGIELDANGYACVDELIDGINRHKGNVLDYNLLCEIVEADKKMRYSFSTDNGKIRANQGHSIEVDVELSCKIPPDTLYHGTATRFEQSIDEKGLLAQNRLYVHLSSDLETAKVVGARHGKVLVYEVNCKEMVLEDYKFYISENGVWLIEHVPAVFLN